MTFKGKTRAKKCLVNQKPLLKGGSATFTDKYLKVRLSDLDVNKLQTQSLLQTFFWTIWSNPRQPLLTLLLPLLVSVCHLQVQKYHLYTTYFYLLANIIIILLRHCELIHNHNVFLVYWLLFTTVLLWCPTDFIQWGKRGRLYQIKYQSSSLPITLFTQRLLCMIGSIPSEIRCLYLDAPSYPPELSQCEHPSIQLISYYNTFQLMFTFCIELLFILSCLVMLNRAWILTFSLFNAQLRFLMSALIIGLLLTKFLACVILHLWKSHSRYQNLHATHDSRQQSADTPFKFNAF